MCKCCGEAPETLEHAFLLCKAREFAWNMFPIVWDGISEHKWNFWIWWESMQEARSRLDG